MGFKYFSQFYQISSSYISPLLGYQELNVGTLWVHRAPINGLPMCCHRGWVTAGWQGVSTLKRHSCGSWLYCLPADPRGFSPALHPLCSHLSIIISTAMEKAPFSEPAGGGGDCTPVSPPTSPPCPGPSLQRIKTTVLFFF